MASPYQDLVKRNEDAMWSRFLQEVVMPSLALGSCHHDAPHLSHFETQSQPPRLLLLQHPAATMRHLNLLPPIVPIEPADAESQVLFYMHRREERMLVPHGSRLDSEEPLKEC